MKLETILKLAKQDNLVRKPDIDGDQDYGLSKVQAEASSRDGLSPVESEASDINNTNPESGITDTTKKAQERDKASRLGSYLSYLLGGGIGSGLYGGAKTDSAGKGLATGAAGTLGGAAGAATGFGLGLLGPQTRNYNPTPPSGMSNFAKNIFRRASRRSYIAPLTVLGSLIGGGEATRAATNALMPKAEPKNIQDKVKALLNKQGSTNNDPYLDIYLHSFNSKLAAAGVDLKSLKK